MYRAPVDEIAFTLKHVTGFAADLDSGRFGDLSEDLVDAIVAEAGRFAAEEIAPLARVGDEQGAVLKDGAVTTPPGWADLYRRWCEGGWNGLAAPEEFGGQALPTLLSVAAFEMWNSGSMAFAIGPTLTVGAIEALDKHATPELQQKYLEKLVSGEWMGTMNLTEPQAGSDLNALKARAEPVGDGTYRIFGQKIFITYGEHDFTDNIVHLVLARLPDAPAGTKGISLFLVPKFFVNDDGSLGARNDAFCASMEHKLGIHASPTCTMIYGDGKFGDTPGAVGWLIGEENRGLACMFTMMNNARLAVGMQGVGIAETATQKALAYAQDRRQGRAAGFKGEGMSPIVAHPDIKRMLLTMKAQTQMARAITYSCAYAIDRARLGEGDEAKAWQARADILTPMAKAFSTDVGVDVASLGVQVHGGMGYVEETGAAALYRDARIAPIYEGTNGIQAIDLVMRKLPLQGGEAMAAFLNELRADHAALSDASGLGATAERLGQALDDLEETAAYLTKALSEGRVNEALCGATPYLRLFSLVIGVALNTRALAAGDRPDHAVLVRFMAENLLVETATLRQQVIGGADSLDAAADALLSA
ncbi:acyl-CoA dehydrogenase [Nitratireductor aquimarinus]|uniref:acyl-CoA dehydrogenase n=1 Tax=Nitratireductor aquimarinus TaxID=889300 RepID=UPI001A8E4B1E|nr:acyl-CoA dehydrogenase [Nitratireductor aquimarinus]MBN8242096.1 acyl-CoA dehydrogenase [Nitratireductor aquimarinus]MBY6130482.1 acyl-CoA dehydrogenase [Nitratireductor aquimarinus]MCA1302763.1 acyl-CoA dehydrogenase [Nitratireductor aquimarinus]